MVTFEEIKNNEEINTYIRMADESLKVLGYTEHGKAHIGTVVARASYVLTALNYPEREIELVKIAGYMHDIGNLVNRAGHSQSGAIMAFRILDNLGMPPSEISKIVTAIGNHDEGTGVPVSDLAAALILADKSDVRRSRVRDRMDGDKFDIHDRVNYSVTQSELTVDTARRAVRLELTVDTRYSPIMDYFQIFMERTNLCRRAAEELGLHFELLVNGQRLV